MFLHINILYREEMLLIDNIFLIFGRHVFHQTVGVHMSTNCAPLLVDLFLYSLQAHFMDWLFKESEEKLALYFNLPFCYIDNICDTDIFKRLTKVASVIFRSDDFNLSTRNHCFSNFLVTSNNLSCSVRLYSYLFYI
jgi:hypothetical protein